ncbi:MAG: tRNA uridine-5-carboxymethylaminomethyl(34) synthesis GTPase MnmE [Gammaproteobacteria bacterium]|nr:MAG: tRNA uridine-5-carboxymethylaminomethyl(34) synthesis GTPase MnmE [Gammaproteobacteria bacterium]
MVRPDGDTIAAVATPPGRGGVGIVRVSGPKALPIAEAVSGRVPAPREATFARFRDAAGEVIDEGLVLYFRAPHSFTGEEVVEFQGHGGPVVMDLLLERVLSLGARPARPGEFSERAFLNDKLDLAQAEAIADLIDAETRAAARLAVRSLEGAFSDEIHALVEATTHLRMYVEAAIDFPEEEIDFLADERVARELQELTAQLQRVRDSARSGCLLREGMRLVIAGRPNAGKSSLLNALAGAERAIVTEVPGTTRDLLREQIQIDGMPLHLIDTAGLRETRDAVERIGVDRARAEIAEADRILWVYDGAADPGHAGLAEAELPSDVPVTLVRNKVDLSGGTPGLGERDGLPEVRLSARTGAGIDALRGHLRQVMGLERGSEGQFLARRRHLEALERAANALAAGQRALTEGQAGELLAEDLRQVQLALSGITGEFTADDLLGEIFSSFCIGK